MVRASFEDDFWGKTVGMRGRGVSRSFVLGGSTSLGAEVPYTLNSFRVLLLALGGATVCVINRYTAMVAASLFLEAAAAFQNNHILSQIKMIDPNLDHQASLGISTTSDSS